MQATTQHAHAIAGLQEERVKQAVCPLAGGFKNCTAAPASASSIIACIVLGISPNKYLILLFAMNVYEPIKQNKP
jgi:hypothetical protein